MILPLELIGHDYQWPGYADTEEQLQLKKPKAHTPITVGKLLNFVGRALSRFFEVSKFSILVTRRTDKKSIACQ